MSTELGKGQVWSGGGEVGILQQDAGDRLLVRRDGSGTWRPKFGVETNIGEETTGLVIVGEWWLGRMRAARVGLGGSLQG